MTGQSAKLVEFGPFELNLNTGELKKHGTRVRLQGKPCQILLALLERPGEVVSREDLKARLWPSDTFVDFDSGLNTAANRLRLALGDSADVPRYIETFARTGYRFIAPVTEVKPVETPPEPSPEPPVPAAAVAPQKRRQWIAAGAVALCALTAAATYLAAHRPAGLPQFRQLTYRTGRIDEARFGPDGQTVVYSADWGSGLRKIYVTTSLSPETRTLPYPNAGLASISRTGELALIVPRPQGLAPSLAQVPLNGGSPRVVTEGPSTADWDPDANHLAICRTGMRQSVLEYPIGKVLYKGLGAISMIRVSPAGDAVAFLEHVERNTTGGDVRMVSTDGVARTVSSGWSSLTGLAWSPSGREIWFTAGKSGVPRIVYAATPAGALREVAVLPGTVKLHDVASDDRTLISMERARMLMEGSWNGAPAEELSWFDWSHAVDLSRDGKLLLFDETGDGGGAEGSVYLYNRESGATVRLGAGYALSLSSDGKRALTLAGRDNPQLVVLPVGPGAPRKLPSNGLHYQWARFFPDGVRILAGGSLKGGPLRLFIESADGGNPEPVPSDAYFGAALVSPDQTRVGGVSAGVIAILPLPAGPLRYFKLPFAAIPLRWSDDGKVLYVRETRSRPAQIYRVNTETGVAEPWKQIAPRESVGWDGAIAIQLAANGRDYVCSYARSLSELFVVRGWR